MLKKFLSAVIGLGQIGQGYDYAWPDSTRVLTHATGFTYHDSFELIGGVDPDSSARKRFEKKFERPAYSNIKGLLAREQPEIISIAVPTKGHFVVFEDIIKIRPRAIICEKPIAASLKEAEHMLAMSKEHDSVLLVNYMRRYEPGVLALKKALEQGEIGDIYKGCVWYSKGLLNNGSHLIDLLIFLLGDVCESGIIGTGGILGENDPDPDIYLRFKQASIYMFSAREESFSFNNIRLIGTQGEVQYAESGNAISIRKAKSHPDYPGYRILNPDYNVVDNDLKRYQWHVLEHLKNYFINGTAIHSDGKSAVSTLKVIEEIYSCL